MWRRFASVGSKLDVSGNDMLMWWEHDDVTKLAVLYLESFGNPRKFARPARRVGAKMPVLTVHAASHGQGSADQARVEQAGVIVTGSVGELAETAALLATQPVPAGRTVAIVSNTGGAGVLAADACTELGLTVHRPRGLTRRRLRTLLPGGAVTGPVDTTPAVSGEDFRRCLELLAADEDVDAMIALVLPTGATGDLIAAIQDADVGVPLAVVELDQVEAVRLMSRSAGGQIPVYDVPEAAAVALAHAVRYGAWRTGPHGQVPSFPDLRAADARALVTGFLHREADGGWLPTGPTADLLRCYGIRLVDAEPAQSEDEAVKAAGAVEPMVTGGTEVTIGVTHDRVFGPLVVFGPGDHAARLTPLTDTDADALIRSADAVPWLSGQRGVPATDLDTLRELLLRVSRLADDLPKVTELDLNPVIARPHRCTREC